MIRNYVRLGFTIIKGNTIQLYFVRNFSGEVGVQIPGFSLDSVPKPKPNIQLEEQVELQEVQDHWRAMENRVKHRKTKKEGPRGRSGLRPSAWDHENV